MNKRSLRNGAIVVITLAALTGVGTMVASASTRGGAAADTAAQQRGDGAADPAGNAAGQQRDNNAANDNDDDNRRVDPDASPTPFDPDRSPAPFDPDPSRSPFDPDALDPDAAQAANANACVAVQVINAQGNDDAQLCTTVQRAGTRVDRVRVSLTAPAGVCRDSVTLRVADQADVVPCAGGGTTTTTFNLGQQVADGAQICGGLAANNQFAAARACVRITA